MLAINIIRWLRMVEGLLTSKSAISLLSKWYIAGRKAGEIGNDRKKVVVRSADYTLLSKVIMVAPFRPVV